MFEIVKKGYSTSEVNSFAEKQEALAAGLKIQNTELKKENQKLLEELKAYREKDGQIRDALVTANDVKAAAEEDSLELLKITTAQTKDIGQRMWRFVEKIRQKYGLIDEVEDQAHAFTEEVRELVQKTLAQNPILDDDAERRKENHRQLLNRMASNGLLQSISSNKRKSDRSDTRMIEYHLFTESLKTAAQKASEAAKEEEARQRAQKRKEGALQAQKSYAEETERLANLNALPSRIKPILNMEENGKGKYASLLDKYLDEVETDDFAASVYAQKLTKRQRNIFSIPDSFPTMSESGFDLKEAVNPKESLEDIMADFDFSEVSKDKK